ncbi:MAG: hypothetical protein IJ010_01225 [Ruminococcus sp.]|nr:hypothetical protein [Ruminococcus sp.]
MPETASMLLIISLWLAVIPGLWSELCNLRSWIRCEIKRIKHRRYLKREYRRWYDKAKSCDSFGGAIDKGMAIARLIIIRHELETSSGIYITDEQTTEKSHI